MTWQKKKKKNVYDSLQTPYNPTLFSIDLQARGWACISIENFNDNPWKKRDCVTRAIVHYPLETAYDSVVD